MKVGLKDTPVLKTQASVLLPEFHARRRVIPPEQVGLFRSARGAASASGMTIILGGEAHQEQPAAAIEQGAPARPGSLVSETDRAQDSESIPNWAGIVSLVWLGTPVPSRMLLL